jgi:hypothetical protein
MSNQQKNNLGQFYTNLSKTANSAANTLKNIIKNTPNTVNSLIPLTNSTKRNVNIPSVSSNSIVPVANSKSSSITTKLAWPIAVFVVIAIISIFILLKYKTQIEVGLNIIGDKIREFFNKSKATSEESDNNNVPVPPAPPVAPQDQAPVQESQNILDNLLSSGQKEVFNISKNDYTYYDAEPLCRALGAELATYDQVKESLSKGADWCNYGWVKGQAAVYPTQENTWKKIQSGPDENKNSCGAPGLNGGYFENPELRYGVNCYGKKPVQSDNDEELLMKKGKIPSSVPNLEVDRKTQEFKKNLDEIGVLPFNNSKWNE